MKNLLIILFVCFTSFLYAQNQAPQISNFNISLTGNEVLRIQYDLLDFENDDVIVSLHIKKSDGITYSINTENATGDLNVVRPGLGKFIEWNYSDELTSNSDYVIKLVAQDTASIDIQSIVDQVDINKLRSDLEFIEGIRHRSTGADHLQATRDFIDQRFINYGFNSTVQNFDFGSWTGKNHIGTKKGTTDDEIVYICDAHYDSVSSSPGADDNGSGVVGFLEAARVLSNFNFKKTIKFIGFDLEESGLIGSIAYVKDKISPEEEIVGVLNFEMIGYYSDQPNSQTLPNGFNILYPNQVTEIENDSFRGNFIGNFGLENQSDWSLAYDNAASKYVPDLNVITFDVPQNWAIIAPDLGRSDHAPFWQADIPAVMLSGTANFRNPYYHTPNDKVSTLDLIFMSNVVKGAIATLAEEAGIHNSSFVEDTVNIVITSITDVNQCKFKSSPNPVNDVLSFKLTNCDFEQFGVEIYNLKGNLVFEKDNLNIGKEFFLDVIDWENGIYILKSKSGKNSYKFVIQH